MLMLSQLEDPIISLEDQGFKQLYTPPRTPTDGDIHSRKHTDREFILKRLAKSIMLNFLELLGVLSVNPEQVSLLVHIPPSSLSNSTNTN